jgi:hypothetical protein
MKIALCFSGQPRGLSVAYEYYKRSLLSVYDVDVFCHSWSSDLDQQILDLYNPKDYIFEPVKFDENDDKKYVNTPNPDKWPPRFTLSAFYSINESKKMFQSAGINYDWVIKTRYDYALNVKIPFDQLDKKKLYIPNCRMVPERNFGNDQFAFSSELVMSKYMSTYENLDIYYSRGTQMIGEEMLKANLIHNDLVGENLVYVDMNNPFPPGKYNGTWHSLVREDYEEWIK